jgi:hypothetical protein
VARDIVGVPLDKGACVLDTEITLTGIEVNLLVRVLRRELQGTLHNQTAIDLARVIGKLDRAAVDPIGKSILGQIAATATARPTDMVLDFARVISPPPSGRGRTPASSLLRKSPRPPRPLPPDRSPPARMIWATGPCASC